MYKVENLSFDIDKRTILKDINLEIKSNNFLSIVGANGSGKSTLIKLINKNLEYTKGDIYLDDKSILNYDTKTLALRRAVLNQSFAFILNFKVVDIIQMSLNVFELSPSKKEEILKFIIDRLNIKDILERNYETLSGGQKQRVQFARVISQLFINEEQNKFLFLDEPTLNLDIHQQINILELTKELVNEYNLGVCAILHDLNQAYYYSDEVAILNDGKLVSFGKTKEILTQDNIKRNFHVNSDIIYSEKLKQNILVVG